MQAHSGVGLSFGVLAPPTAVISSTFASLADEHCARSEPGLGRPHRRWHWLGQAEQGDPRGQGALGVERQLGKIGSSSPVPPANAAGSCTPRRRPPAPGCRGSRSGRPRRRGRRRRAIPVRGRPRWLRRRGIAKAQTHVSLRKVRDARGRDAQWPRDGATAIRRPSHLPTASAARRQSSDGTAGVVATEAGAPVAVLIFTVTDGRITAIDALAGPTRVPGGPRDARRGLAEEPILGTE
jgi:hypothetical protein